MQHVSRSLVAQCTSDGFAVNCGCTNKSLNARPLSAPVKRL